QILAAPASGRVSTVDEQTLADLRRALAEQAAIFSDDSPNLQALRARIADLEKRQSAAKSNPADVSQRTDVSPEIKVTFADLAGQLTFIAQEKDSVRRTLADLAQSVVDTETTSTMLSALERNYESTQAQYNEAAARLAAASTGQRIETESIGEKLTL